MAVMPAMAAALAAGDAARVIALARASGVDPEIALSAASDRLVERFAKAEAQAAREGGWDGLAQAEREKYWNLVKLSD